jgi:VWFA-related protein
MRLIRSVLISFACTVCLTAALAAQAPASDQNTVPLIKANVRAVVVDVVVTGGKDEPVQGLQKQDFQIMEDGKPMTIDFFEEQGAKTSAAETIKSQSSLPPNVYSNVPPVAGSDSVDVLLIDTLNTEVGDQLFVRKQILKFLQGMKPGTRVAIFSLGSQFRFLQGFTSDVSLLQAALNDVKKGVNPQKDPAFHSRSDEQDDAWERSEMAAVAAMIGGNGGVLVEGLQSAQSEASDMGYEKRVAMTLEALGSIARYLAGVPGRKNLIWFASSFPVAVFPNFQQREQMADNRISVSQVKKTADLLTASKVAVYPINAEGMANNRTLDAEHNIIGGPAVMASIGAETGTRANEQVKMERLAQDTGGKAFYNTNDLDGAMEHAIEDGTHYYTISYTPTNNKMDGNYRKVEVKLTTGKYKLAYRRGYNAADAPATAPKPEGDPLRPLLAYGRANSTEVLYQVRVAPVSPQPAATAARAGLNPKLAGSVTRYSVNFAIPWKDVSFAPAPDGTYNGKINVGVIAYGSDGKAVNWMGGTQAMNLKPEVYAAIQRSGVPAHMEIDLPDQDVSLVTGVYDWGTDRAGTLEIPVHPEAVSAAR